MTTLPFLDAGQLQRVVSPASALSAIEDALRGEQPAQRARSAVNLRAGQLLLMPAEAAGSVGVKLLSVAPGNLAKGLPRVQGVYVLFDATTLAPVALIDGAALTSVRTPAVSAVAIARLARPGAAELVVFGSGPQAWGHVLAIRETGRSPGCGLSAATRSAQQCWSNASWTSASSPRSRRPRL